MTPNIRQYIRRQATGWNDLHIVELGAGIAPGQEDLAVFPVVMDAGGHYTGIDSADADHTHYTADLTEISPESDIADVIREADVVLCLETLEHIPRFWRVLDVFSWMRPGATLIVSVPAFHFFYHPHPVDCYRFHEDAAPALFEGFRIVDTVRLPDTAGKDCIVWRAVREGETEEPAS